MATAAAAPDQLYADIERAGALPRDVSVADAVSAVVCTLAARVGASLPRALDGVVSRCARHERRGAERFDTIEFVRRVADHLGASPQGAERLARLVFAALRARLLDDEAQAVGAHLPRGLKEMWLGDEVAPEPDVDLVGRRMLAEIEQDGTLPSGRSALEVATAVLAAATRRVSRGEAHKLVQALPPTLQAALAPAVRDRIEPPVEAVSRAALRDDIAWQLAVGPDDADALMRLVCDVVRAHLRGDAHAAFCSQLPGELKALWRGRAR